MSPAQNNEDHGGKVIIVYGLLEALRDASSSVVILAVIVTIILITHAIANCRSYGLRLLLPYL